ncbi:threonylcarbamoyl-AMP synthase [Candidatus Uhrbacteria bacterium]|nr:threonylcarbamoyl-AMP synthase [Candidatus Uhrbacteria bacterium]
MNLKTLKKEILKGKIFIYPTDTVYGIGCNAFDKKSVDKIRRIKRRDTKPFSIIAPNFDWIQEYCIIQSDFKKYLFGPYTIILKKKNPSFLKWVSDTETLGVRMPNHPFTKKIQKTYIPFITTSVNFSGEKSSSSIDEIPKEILDAVDYVIQGGILNERPSTLIIEGKESKR